MKNFQFQVDITISPNTCSINFVIRGVRERVHRNKYTNAISANKNELKFLLKYRYE